MKCIYCGKSPCVWTKYEAQLIEEFNKQEPAIDAQFETNDDINRINSTKRKFLYKIFTRLRYGILGKGNRKVLPACVTKGIRFLFPDSNEDYMGHKHS